VKRFVLSAALVLAALTFAAPAALAQGTGGFQFGLSGGASFPTGDAKDVYDNGWHGGIVLNYELPALPLGLRVDGDYRKWNGGSSCACSDRSAEMFDGNANLVLGLRIVLVKLYALGGAGVYNVKFSGGGDVSSPSQTDFGWNAGAGVAFVIGKVSIFGEGRYHEVSLDSSGGKFKFVAATAGVLF
jgi:opacity protein-like surface antigen